MPKESIVRSIFIVRHAEALKTVSGIHGGGGTLLTSQGVQDVALISQFLRNELSAQADSLNIFASMVPQVAETGQLLAQALGVQVVPRERLRGINMGVLDGLKDVDAWQKYPEIMTRLDAWRKGQLDVNDIGITDAEPLSTFLARISSEIEEILALDANPCCLISTRSVGIAAMNALLNQSSLLGKPYTRFRLDPGSVTRINFQSFRNGEVIYCNRSDFLGRKMDYPDD